MPTPLIRTKLHRPPVDTVHLHRQHLLDRLNKRLHRPLTLVSAPAGYGKSTLVSGWLDSCAIPSAWLSLDENDNDLRLFLSYLLAAIRDMFPDAVRHTLEFVNALLLKRNRAAIRSRLGKSSAGPSFSTVPNSFQNPAYFS